MTLINPHNNLRDKNLTCYPIFILVFKRVSFRSTPAHVQPCSFAANATTSLQPAAQPAAQLVGLHSHLHSYPHASAPTATLALATASATATCPLHSYLGKSGFEKVATAASTATFPKSTTVALRVALQVAFLGVLQHKRSSKRTASSVECTNSLVQSMTS